MSAEKKVGCFCVSDRGFGSGSEVLALEYRTCVALV